MWEGAPWKLEADALVVPTNETLSDRRGGTGVALDLAGSQVIGSDWLRGLGVWMGG